MDVLERLNGMLIKGLVCCLRHRAHRQIRNFPLAMSVISADARQPCCPPHHHHRPQTTTTTSTITTWRFDHNMVSLDFKMWPRWKEVNFHDPAAAL